MKTQIYLIALLVALTGCENKDICKDAKSFGHNDDATGTNQEIVEKWANLYNCKNPQWKQYPPKSEGEWNRLDFTCRVDDAANMKKVLNRDADSMNDVRYIDVTLTMGWNKDMCGGNIKDWNAIVYHKNPVGDLDGMLGMINDFPNDKYAEPYNIDFEMDVRK